MDKRHKHADLIIAWANGAEIQSKLPCESEWHTCNPTWSTACDYRIKPKTIKYRVALFQYTNNYFESQTVDTLIEAQKFESYETFVRWLTDWIEVEV